MRKLRAMEKAKGILKTECQIMIDTNYLIVYDKKDGQVAELFPIDLVADPTSVVTDGKKEIFNNTLLFTTLEDSSKKSPPIMPTEMHIFQSLKTNSTSIVDEIFKVKEARQQMLQKEKLVHQLKLHQQQHLSPAPIKYSHHSEQLPQQIQLYQSGQQHAPQPFTSYSNQPQMLRANDVNNRMPEAETGYRKVSSLSRLEQNDQNNNAAIILNPSGILKQRSNNPPPADGFNSQSNSSKIQHELNVMNHCFDDIERFVQRLQATQESIKTLEKCKRKPKTLKRKNLSEDMLPQPQQLVDIYQKFKCSFNLLAKLKAYIHNPNSPELVHFLFNLLDLIYNTTYRGVAETVWQPMITRETKDLLSNCLTTKEQALLYSLGDAWTTSPDEIKLQPHLYQHIDLNQIYSPVFFDGWASNIHFQDDPCQSALVQPTQVQPNRYAQVQQQSVLFKGRGNETYPSNQQRPIVHANQLPNNVIEHHTTTNLAVSTGVSSSAAASAAPTTGPSNIKNYDEMKKWAVDLSYRGGKVYEVVHDRNGNNDKELTIKSGELLEVLDDKRNWWKLRNFYGIIGHAPVTILRPFEISNTNTFENKLGYY
jgi:epidermal growth factor receptor kinase substrate 8